MNISEGRFVMPEEVKKLVERKAVVLLERIYKMPTLALDEIVELKGLPLRVEKIKPSGKLWLRFATPTRIGFWPLEVVTIKGVQFKVTWTCGEKIGLRMLVVP